MKQSKFFIAGSAIVLAIAAAFGAKARMVNHNWYYTTVTNSVHKCYPITTPSNCSVLGSGCTTTISGVGTFQLYTQKIGTDCFNALKQ